VNTVARHGVEQRCVECPSCMLVQADPKPELHTLRRYYESGQYRAAYPLTPGPLYQATLDPAFIEARARRLVELHGVRSWWSVYDHGCSDGSTMAALHTLTDCHVFGSDADPAMVALARAAGVGDVTQSPWDEGAPVDCNLVTAHHVLEHDLDPVAFVRMLATRARAIGGGAVHVEVPDVEDITGPRESWFQWPHVVSFSARTLRATLEAGGLREVQTDKLGRFLIGWGKT
jgi:SAM-dependent methyltransferase